MAKGKTEPGSALAVIRRSVDIRTPDQMSKDLRHAAWMHDGYQVFEQIVETGTCADILTHIPEIAGLSGSSRNLLAQDWCLEVAKTLRAHHLLNHAIPEHHVATQCTYFEKSARKNWLVSWHQDLSISVSNKIAHPDLCGWSEKEGTLFVQAPIAVLENMIAVRLHLDDCNREDGVLRVIPQSHLSGRLNRTQALARRAALPEINCPVMQGGVMLMRPLLLHASSKSTGNGLRRVLHFLFGPRELPYGLEWQYAV